MDTVRNGSGLNREFVLILLALVLMVLAAGAVNSLIGLDRMSESGIHDRTVPPPPTDRTP